MDLSVLLCSYRHIGGAVLPTTKGNYIMNNAHAVFMSDATGEALVKYGRADTSARKAFSEFADRAFADGMGSLNFISPQTEGSLNTEESWAHLLEWAGKAFLTRQEVKYLDTPKEALNPGQRVAKREARQKLGSRIKDVKNAFKRREAQMQAELDAIEGKTTAKDAKAPKPGKTPEAQIIDALNLALKKMRDTEDLAFDPEAPADLVREALTIIAKAAK